MSFTFSKPLPQAAGPCSLCGKPASGKYGLRVGEHRYVVCADRACQGMTSAEAANRLAERAVQSGVHAKPSERKLAPSWSNKGVSRNRGPRCKRVVGCKLAGEHRGKCFSGENE